MIKTEIRLLATINCLLSLNTEMGSKHINCVKKF